MNEANTPQKLIIPRGLIDPEETTVINVPNTLRGSSVVIAKKGGSPGASEQGSFYTPPPRRREFPSLDYPAFMEHESPELPSFYRITEQGENWNKSWGPMPPRRPRSPNASPPARQAEGPELPIDYWSPTKRSTPCRRPPFTTMDLNVPKRDPFSDRTSPIVARMATQSSTIQPATREFPNTIPSRRPEEESFDLIDSDVEEEEKEAEEEEEERLHALDQLEFVENDTLVQDLLNMQRERRKVVYDMANMAPARKSSLKKLLAPLKALKKLKAKLKKKNKVAPMPQ